MMIIIIIMIIIFKDDRSKYFRFGPSSDLNVVSVQIDTWNKYIILIIIISFLKSCDVLILEVGNPIITFRVYNPDCKIINDFGIIELNFLTNAMYTITGFRNIIMVVVNVTQFDIALFGMLVSEIISMFTVRILLKEKRFLISEV